MRVASRRLDRAEEVVARIREKTSSDRIAPVAVSTRSRTRCGARGRDAGRGRRGRRRGVVAATRDRSPAKLSVAIDLNAVPPLGIAGIKVTDKAVQREPASPTTEPSASAARR